LGRLFNIPLVKFIDLVSGRSILIDEAIQRKRSTPIYHYSQDSLSEISETLEESEKSLIEIMYDWRYQEMLRSQTQRLRNTHEENSSYRLNTEIQKNEFDLEKKEMLKHWNQKKQ